MRLHNILWGCVSQSDNGQRPCYPVQVMFNGQRSCLYNLTLHVLRSQFLLQQFDLQREKEMKTKSKLNVSKSTVMCLQWLRKTPVNFGVVSVQVKREEVNNVVTDPPLSRMMANTCIANIQYTSQTPSHTVFLEPQGISLIPRPPPFLPFVCSHNNTREQKTSEKRERSIHHVNDVRWTWGGREVDAGPNCKLPVLTGKKQASYWSRLSSLVLSTSHPPDVIYVMNAPRPSPFFVDLLLPCIIVTATGR